ncbi:hypothetical protein Bhyg_00955 [Pseudolycoriella hygida]|uniref:Uncharacterized protein n=1 Tax=Pseudolycoriella hygida TaxID=35572 RepID=A0A9Q0N8G5_9DIPT|nr:hypothetical protein Bhyg_00955 [Pseudolycoriella hygida]
MIVTVDSGLEASLGEGVNHTIPDREFKRRTQIEKPLISLGRWRFAM